MSIQDVWSRLANGYYNSNPKSASNPGGMASDGHQLNFPAALIDLGTALIQAGIDAQALNAAQPSILAAVNAVSAAQAARDQALAYRNQAQEIVGTDLTLKANVNSPALTGTPTSPTPAQADNSTRIATTSFVTQKFAALVGGAPGALDTIYEIAAALGNDPNLAATLAAQIGAKFDKTGGQIAGDIVFPSPQTTQRNIYWAYPAGAVHFYGHGAAVGLYDLAPGAGSVWTYTLATKTLDLKAGATVGGAQIYTSANLAPVTLAGGQTISGLKVFASPGATIASAASGDSALQVAGAGAAYIAFHRSGSYAVHFGLDSDNQLKVGGWSAGAVSYKLWTESNDGSGSGLDADLLRGAPPAVLDTPDSIAKRDSSGSLTMKGAWVNEHIHVANNGRLYWEAWGGGLEMTDAAKVRTVNNKGFSVGSGRMDASGYDVTSDKRLKREIVPLVDVGELIDALGVYAYYKEGRLEWGSLAQEYFALSRTRHLVGTTGEVRWEGEPPVMTIDPGGQLAMALAELKALRVRVAKLEAGR